MKFSVVFSYLFISIISSHAEAEELIVRLLPNETPRSLSPELRRVLDRYSVDSVAPLYPFNFKEPHLAHSLGLDRYIKVKVEQESAQALSSDLALLVESVEPIFVGEISGDPVYPDEPWWPAQYGLHNTGQSIRGQVGTNDADIDAPMAWGLVDEATFPVRLAVIDTGVNDLHWELESSIVSRMNSITWNPDDTRDTGCPHGTHVAGIIAAQHDGRGIAGFFPAVDLVVVKSLQNCFGNDIDFANGILWAVDEADADVLNLSVNFRNAGSYLANAVAYAHQRGRVLIAAAGNRGEASLGFPASYSEVLSVGATDNRDILADFSNFGSELDLVAPGVDIFSSYNQSLEYMSGTSQAVPFVSATVGLMLSINPHLRKADIETILLATADDLGAVGRDDFYGSGRLNAFRALFAAKCRPDLNFDTQLNVTDFMAFRSLFVNGNLLADFSNDGTLNVNDFVAYRNFYVLGCP